MAFVGGWCYVVVVVVTPGADWRVEGFKDRDQEVDGGEADHVR